MTSKKSEKVKLSIQNLERAVAALDKSLSLPIQEDRDLSGIIKDFEIAFELSWKTLKKVLQEGGIDANSPKEILSKAYQTKMTNDEVGWLGMLKDRNLTAHVYDHEFIKTLVAKIKTEHLQLFKNLVEKLQ